MPSRFSVRAQSPSTWWRQWSIHTMDGPSTLVTGLIVLYRQYIPYTVECSAKTEGPAQGLCIISTNSRTKNTPRNMPFFYLFYAQSLRGTRAWHNVTCHSVYSFNAGGLCAPVFGISNNFPLSHRHRAFSIFFFFFWSTARRHVMRVRS